MKQYLNILLIALFLSCTNNIQTLDVGKFTIQVPSNWNIVKEDGIDSYVGKIAIDEKDTISFDLGWYSNSLEEDTSGIRNLLNNTSYEIINGRKAKIIQPKKSGKGIIGIYIDSLWKKGEGIDKFQLNGKNLKLENEILLLNAIRTIKFKDK